MAISKQNPGTSPISLTTFQCSYTQLAQRDAANKTKNKTRDEMFSPGGSRGANKLQNEARLKLRVTHFGSAWQFLSDKDFPPQVKGL